MSSDKRKEEKISPTTKSEKSGKVGGKAGRSKQSQTADLCDICGTVQYDADHQCDQDTGTADSLTADPMIGQVIGRHYQVLSFIGRGGMSSVFKARHQLLKKTVALKVLTPQLRMDSQKLMRFQQEAISVGRLDHKNIIKIYEFAVPDDREPYLVMDFIEGVALSEEISKGPLPLDRGINIFQQICDGLAHAHLMGVIHRDLKPSNVMLVSDEDGRETVKIVDFGIAKILTSEPEEAKLTQTGEIFGSPLYMSPEQCLGKSLDARSDIYSLGCLMFETLTARPPFEGLNVLETIQKHLNAAPPMVSDIEYSSEINAIILKCLAKDASQRYQNMEQVRKDLDKLGNFGGGNLFTKLGTFGRLAVLRLRSVLAKAFAQEFFVLLIVLIACGIGFIVWQHNSIHFFKPAQSFSSLQSSDVGAQKSLHPSIVAPLSDGDAQKQFQHCSDIGQQKFDNGDLAGAKAAFSAFESTSMSRQQEMRLKPLIYDQLRDLAFVENNNGLVEKYTFLSAKLRKNAAKQPYLSAIATLEQLERVTHPERKFDDDIFDTLNDEVHSIIDFGALREAKEVLDRTLKIVDQHLPPTDAHVGRTEKNLAYVLWKDGDLQESRHHYKKALAIRELKPGYFDLDLVTTLHDAAELDLVLGDYNEAHGYLDQAIDLLKNNGNINICMMADLHVLRAKVFHAIGLNENVSSELAEAKSVYAVTPVQNDFLQEKADFLVQCARFLPAESSDRKELQKDLWLAVRLYEQAVKKEQSEFALALIELSKSIRSTSGDNASPLSKHQDFGQMPLPAPLIERAKAIASRLPEWERKKIIESIEKLGIEVESKK